MLSLHAYLGSLSTDELTFDSSSHTVSCVSSGGPVNTVTWSRNGDPITSSTSPYQLSQSLTSGVTSTFLHTLTITGGDAEDYNGTFSCTVSNSRGPAPVQSLDIHSRTNIAIKANYVHTYFSPIDILISRNDQPHDPSSTVAITCSSDLAVQTMRWLNEGGQELFANVGQQQLNLTIDSVGLELDNTMYTCEVTAAGITIAITESIIIRVNSKHIIF